MPLFSWPVGNISVIIVLPHPLKVPHMLFPLDQISTRQDRIRKDFDSAKLHELANDIIKVGLLHAPVVDKAGYILAGERRLRAIRKLSEGGFSFRYGSEVIKPGFIPVTQFHSTEEIELLQAELSENIVRADISWQEKMWATNKLFELRRLQREVNGEEELTKTEATIALANEIAEVKGLALVDNTKKGSRRESSTAGSVREDLIIASFKDDEEVMKAPTKKEALKIITQKLEAEHRIALSREYKKKAPESSHNLIHGDCVLEILSIPDGTFHCVVTDPPYGVGIDTYSDLQGGVDHHYDDSADVLDNLLDTLPEQLFRVTKEKAHLYWFCDFLWYERIQNALKAANWDVWPRPLIWHRSDSTGMLPRPEHGPRRNYECILYAIKGNKRVNYVANDVIPIASEKGMGTAARKPSELYKELLRRSCVPGDLVFDPCCGSGPIFEAAQSLELWATGIELNEQLFGVCTQRLAGQKK
jgi:site-specific DNA-methyltransferase (adenine-specific)